MQIYLRQYSHGPSKSFKVRAILLGEESDLDIENGYFGKLLHLT